MAKENIEPESARATWDIAWKTFFDSSKVWCRGFVTYLLGSEYAEYFVESTTIVNESERIPTYGADKSTDAVIAFTVDGMTKKILAEFQSYSDPTIGMRTLNYAINKGQMLKSTPTEEMWYLPDAFIVNVRTHSSSVAGVRTVNFELSRGLYHIQIPVVNAFESLPEIQVLMDGGNSSKAIQAMYALYSKVTRGLDVSEIPDEEFVRACALIAIPKAFSGEGATEKEVSSMVFDYDASRPTVIERIEARGLEKGVEKGIQQGIQKGQAALVKNLMKLRNWTQEQTIEFLTTGVLPEEKQSGKSDGGSSGMHKMDLG